MDVQIAVFTLKQVVDGSRPVRYVVHDSDNTWQFLTYEEVSMNDVMIISLEEMLEIDPSLKDILWLQENMQALRDGIGSEWQTSVYGE